MTEFLADSEHFPALALRDRDSFTYDVGLRCRMCSRPGQPDADDLQIMFMGNGE
jgi:hypothetical protein